MRSDHDKSAVEAAQADVYLMLGRVGDAIDAYEQALEHAPYRTNLYLPLVGAHKVRLTPAWKCVHCMVGLSHPGAPTLSCTCHSWGRTRSAGAWGRRRGGT